MSANQIIIPLALAAFAGFVVFVVIRTRRAKARTDATRTHKAQNQAPRNDPAAMARSAHSGYSGSQE